MKVFQMEGVALQGPDEDVNLNLCFEEQKGPAELAHRARTVERERLGKGLEPAASRV